MKVVDTGINEIKLIEPQVFNDERGYFLESFQAARYQQLLALQMPFVQDNVSYSKQGVLRGLHFQTRHPQGKLVCVLQGEIFDVAVDIRLDSPTFGKWQGVTLSPKQQLWIPPGFAHGFAVLSPEALVEYKCTAYYHPEFEACLRWDDPDVAIQWPLDRPVLSAKDRLGLSLQTLRTAGGLA